MYRQSTSEKRQKTVKPVSDMSLPNRKISERKHEDMEESDLTDQANPFSDIAREPLTLTYVKAAPSMKILGFFPKFIEGN
jgi:hypothetical protein